MMSFLIVLLFVVGSIGLIVVACNVKDDYPSEQDWEELAIGLQMVHERLSHFLNEYGAYMKEIKNKDNNYNEKEDDF